MVVVSCGWWGLNRVVRLGGVVVGGWGCLGWWGWVGGGGGFWTLGGGWDALGLVNIRTRWFGLGWLQGTCCGGLWVGLWRFCGAAGACGAHAAVDFGCGGVGF
ncbi:hypothetical protein FNV58_54645 [Streptomyces sp. RLB1-9]|nr:hypothetical protein FNV58_54645 [Streptomyces sp. RLB1-9]